jgi:hypothetical protein
VYACPPAFLFCPYERTLHWITFLWYSCTAECRLLINTHIHTEKLNHSCQRLEGIHGVEVQLHSFLTSKLEGGEMRSSHVPGDKTSDTILWGWLGPRVGPGFLENRTFLYLSGFETQIVQSVYQVTRLPTHTQYIHIDMHNT